MRRWSGEDEVLGDAGQFLGYQKGLLRKYGLPSLAPDDLSPAAEAALAHRLLEDGDTPKEWTVLAWRARDGIYAVALKREGRVRIFTVVPEGEGYAVMEMGEE